MLKIEDLKTQLTDIFGVKKNLTSAELEKEKELESEIEKLNAKAELPYTDEDLESLKKINLEIEKTLKKISHLSEDDKKLLRQMSSSMVNKILHKPTIKLKQKTQSEDGHVYLKAIRHLFHLDD
mgnify:CR=1 FL=1